MKFDNALHIPPGRSVEMLASLGVIFWDHIPSLQSTLVYSAATVDVVGATNTYHRNVGNWTGFAAGDLVDVAGFVNGGNNFRKKVVSVTGPNMVVTSVDAMVLEAAGPAVTFTRVDDMPDRILVVGTDAVSGKISFGMVGDAYPAGDTAFFFVGLEPRVIQVSGYEIIWYTSAAGYTGSLSPVANL